MKPAPASHTTSSRYANALKLWDTIAKGVKWHGYVKNLRRDGCYYWVYATVIPNIRNGEIVGYTSVRHPSPLVYKSMRVQRYTRK